ncbi:alpha/beta hydrolase [Glaciihabitans arcticus]|uniref:Alpha/beta hydrolase n=1 Tax=Glaciihabitans arcticus TaxID=2668039 RepID=A0A4Q9GWG3_9MICO|nr:alpha/beta hydrolase [Glaciihabitans arcticus]TBN57547.1 alpha/beta hydrolase [Glaciihabitans arcticus]
MIERDVPTADGRTVHVFDTGAGSTTVFWHHGSPQTGAPLEPVPKAAESRDIRLVSYARPSYGGSSPQPGRTVADAAVDTLAVADALGLDTFATMGASGGGPHALAAAALLKGRATAAVTLAGIAPFTTGFDWFDGMAAPDGLRSAFVSRGARAAFGEVDEFDPNSFNTLDYAALDGEWKSLGDDVGRSEKWGDDGLIDDDVAFASPWGFTLGAIDRPVLLIQGGDDRVIPAAHAEWMSKHIPTAELWSRPRDGHVSVLSAVPLAFDWLRQAT